MAKKQFSSVLLQFLYATYIAPSANMDIGLHQSKKNVIYQKIDPAFEDLFDLAEEYILTVLLEPWMKMVEADKYTYGKVTDLDDTMKDSYAGEKIHRSLHMQPCYIYSQEGRTITGCFAYPLLSMLMRGVG